MSRDSITVLFAALLITAIALPVLAYEDSAYGFYDGTYCGWDGTHEHWDNNSPSHDSAGGVTGLQYGYDHYCDATRVKMYWEPYNQGPRLDIWVDYFSGVNSGPQRGAEYLYYTDHDVRNHFAGYWAGFRLYH